MNVKMRRETHRASWAALVLLVLGGCSTPMPTQSGFLGDYPRMRPSPRISGAWGWWHPRKRISDYLKIMIDPVTVFLHPQAQSRGVNPDELKELADYFRDQMASRILSSGKYEIVHAAGPGVLRIRAAITDVQPSKVLLNVIPVVGTTGVGVGGASMEAECLDTESGERILAVIATRKGDPFEVQAGSSKWGHTQAVLREWAQVLREALDNRSMQKPIGPQRR